MEATTIRITKELADELKGIKEEWNELYGFIPNYEIIIRTLLSGIREQKESPINWATKK